MRLLSPTHAATLPEYALAAAAAAPAAPVAPAAPAAPAVAAVTALVVVVVQTFALPSSAASNATVGMMVAETSLAMPHLE
jgi:hypothetical protein